MHAHNRLVQNRTALLPVPQILHLPRPLKRIQFIHLVRRVKGKHIIPAVAGGKHHAHTRIGDHVTPDLKKDRPLGRPRRPVHRLQQAHTVHPRLSGYPCNRKHCGRKVQQRHGLSNLLMPLGVIAVSGRFRKNGDLDHPRIEIRPLVNQPPLPVHLPVVGKNKNPRIVVQPLRLQIVEQPPHHLIDQLVLKLVGGHIIQNRLRVAQPPAPPVNPVHPRFRPRRAEIRRHQLPVRIRQRQPRPDLPLPVRHPRRNGKRLVWAEKIQLQVKRRLRIPPGLQRTDRLLHQKRGIGRILWKRPPLLVRNPPPVGIPLLLARQPPAGDRPLEPDPLKPLALQKTNVVVFVKPWRRPPVPWGIVLREHIHKLVGAHMGLAHMPRVVAHRLQVFRKQRIRRPHMNLMPVVRPLAIRRNIGIMPGQIRGPCR